MKEKLKTENRKDIINSETNAISAIKRGTLPKIADTIDLLGVPIMAEKVRAEMIVIEETIETEGTGNTGTETMTEIANIGEIAIENIADALTLMLAPAHPAEATGADQIVRTTSVETDILLKREVPTITLVANIDWHILTE